MTPVRLKAHGMTATLIERGAALIDLRLDGIAHPLVLGYQDPASYHDNLHQFGATIGRFANRLCEGRAQIAGRMYQMDQNTPQGHLIHGGRIGTTQMDWVLSAQTHNSAMFEITLPDGHMGFPGNLHIKALFALTRGPALEITLSAETDAPTLCSLAHHSYFNLDGRSTIDCHQLCVLADHYLPTDAETLPTGEIANVSGTAFDLREDSPLDGRIFDHNFCLAPKRRALSKAAVLTGADGLRMELATTEPGLQVYTGDGIGPQGPTGLLGQPYAARAGVALEPQLWPNAPHHPDFPTAILMPGETYEQRSRFAFG